jgi:hypothetical protein
MKVHLSLLMQILLVSSVPAEVRVWVQGSNSVAWVKYDCTAGERVRAFALDVSVDRGRIIGVSHFFTGQSTAAAQGYGIFPASFRDHIAAGLGTNINWDVSGYTPVAVQADNPAGTLTGLNSSGVTLEFGGLWDPNVPAAVPGSAGTLCSLSISAGAMVSVSANTIRGGVVVVGSDAIPASVFIGAFVQPPEIVGLSLTNGLLRVTFAGGELEKAPTIAGPWTGTGDSDGQYTELVGSDVGKFYRVRNP